MRTTPATWAEVDTWLTVLHQRGHLHHAQPGAEDTRIVQRHHHSRPWTLHHPVLAMDWIAEVLREVQQQATELGQ